MIIFFFVLVDIHKPTGFNYTLLLKGVFIMNNGFNCKYPLLSYPEIIFFAEKT